MYINFRRSLIILIGFLCALSAWALTPEEDLESTIENLHAELKDMEDNIGKELQYLQETRLGYWDHIVQLQKEIDKAVLLLYSQDGGSLFTVGLASEGLQKVCEAFRFEKVPFERWLESMTIASNKHQRIRQALMKIHPEILSPEHRDYVQQSIALCDTLDLQFAALRDSIALDRQRYQRMSKAIDEIEQTNSEVVARLSDAIFNDNDEDVLTFYNSLDFQRQDVYYDTQNSRQKSLTSEAQHINKWDKWTLIISLCIWILGSIAMRFILPKKSPFRSRRRYYALLAALGAMIVSSWIMPFFLEHNNTYLWRIEDVNTDFLLFLFLLILSAMLRLPSPGLGWSFLSYLPFIFCAWSVIQLALMLTRTSVLKTVLPLMFFMCLVAAIVILIFSVRRIKKADYPISFSCIGAVLIASVLAFMGYYYLSIIVVLYGMSIITCISALLCFKLIFKKRLEKVGPITKLTLSYLVYPYFYAFTIVGSMYSVAYIFNLSTWLSEVLSASFVGMPHFGIISVSRILLLIYLAVFVNYIIKLVKLILYRIDRDKYETGNAAIIISVGTMALWILYLITALMVLRINHTGVVAAIGGISIGLGFAMKDTFENFFYGLSMMASRARPGDIVECDDARGVIKKIGIITTQIQIEDGPIVSYPNRQLFTNNFTNLTLNHRREIRHIVFDISAQSDIAKAKDLMLQASQGIDGVVDHENHYVVMRHTNCGIVRLDYKCWIDSSKYLRTEPAVREAIFNSFKANGIEIASFPNEIDMHATAVIMTPKS